jgi:hypothetical protein
MRQPVQRQEELENEQRMIFCFPHRFNIVRRFFEHSFSVYVFLSFFSCVEFTYVKFSAKNKLPLLILGLNLALEMQIGRYNAKVARWQGRYLAANHKTDLGSDHQE